MFRRAAGFELYPGAGAVLASGWVRVCGLTVTFSPRFTFKPAAAVARSDRPCRACSCRWVEGGGVWVDFLCSSRLTKPSSRPDIVDDKASIRTTETQEIKAI